MILRQLSRIAFDQNRKIIPIDCAKRHYKLFYPLKSEIELKLEDHVPNLNKTVDLEENQPVKKYKTIEGKSSTVTKFMVNVKSKNRREKSKMMLLEGKRLIQDGVDAGMQPIALFFSRIGDVASLNLDNNVKLYKISYKNVQFWSELSTTQGIMGIFPIPEVVNFSHLSKLPLTIICDNVRDPGNMGSILRTSAAVGCSKVLLTKGCVDLWEPKVLRSAAGAHFRLNISRAISWDEISNSLDKNSTIYLADSDTPDSDTLTDIYELKDGKKVAIKDESKRITSFQNRPQDDSDMPKILYTAVDYSHANSVVLILGGETEGLSKEAYHFGAEKQGTRIFVPMANGVESLNSGTALGILAYEILRQRVIN